VISFMLGSVLSQMVDNGLANLLVVETLKHGTQPLAYAQIRLYGAKVRDSATVGSTRPGEGGCESNSIGYFFVTKEKATYLQSLVVTRVHTFISTYNNAGLGLHSTLLNKPSVSRHIVFTSLIVIAGLVSTCVTPTLNFRFLKEEIPHRFENDPDYNYTDGKTQKDGPCYRTNQKIEAWRIGFFGTIVASLQGNYLDRVKNNPMRCLKGAIQLIATGFIVWHFYKSLDKTALIAGAFWA
jgi:hypothetical protein